MRLHRNKSRILEADDFNMFPKNNMTWRFDNLNENILPRYLIQEEIYSSYLDEKGRPKSKGKCLIARSLNGATKCNGMEMVSITK